MVRADYQEAAKETILRRKGFNLVDFAENLPMALHSCF
jgi:hypothetical protein